MEKYKVALLTRIATLTRRNEESETLPYPKGMAEAARKAKERLASSGKLEIERDAQREINDRVQEFGKAA
jgi:hypothetical protein